MRTAAFDVRAIASLRQAAAGMLPSAGLRSDDVDRSGRLDPRCVCILKRKLHLRRVAVRRVRRSCGEVVSMREQGRPEVLVLILDSFVHLPDLSFQIRDVRRDALASSDVMHEMLVRSDCRADKLLSDTVEDLRRNECAYRGCISDRLKTEQQPYLDQGKCHTMVQLIVWEALLYWLEDICIADVEVR